MSKSKEPCAGCRDDFYNHGGNSTSGECWMLKKAKLVRRWKLGWWTTPTTPRAFQEVKTYDCHNEPGRYAFQKELPSFAVDPIRIQSKSSKAVIP